MKLLHEVYIAIAQNSLKVRDLRYSSKFISLCIYLIHLYSNSSFVKNSEKLYVLPIIECHFITFGVIFYSIFFLSLEKVQS